MKQVLMKRIFGLSLAFLTVVLPMCFTSCGSDPTQMTSIKLSLSKIENAAIDSIDTIKATISPDDAVNPNVVWTHTTDSVAQFTASGNIAIVKILKHGNDTVCCEAAEGNGVKSFCYIIYEKDEPADTTETDTTDVDSL